MAVTPKRLSDLSLRSDIDTPPRAFVRLEVALNKFYRVERPERICDKSVRLIKDLGVSVDNVVPQLPARGHIISTEWRRLTVKYRAIVVILLESF